MGCHLQLAAASLDSMCSLIPELCLSVCRGARSSGPLKASAASECSQSVTVMSVANLHVVRLQALVSLRALCFMIVRCISNLPPLDDVACPDQSDV